MDGGATLTGPVPPSTVAEAGTPAVTPDPAIVDPAENNVVFTSLVTGDRDIVGLVAYSIYKQNKYDWLQAYSRQQGRMPNAEEANAYLLGESTPRRLATYRHLAEAVLDGRGPEVGGVDDNRPRLKGTARPVGLMRGEARPAGSPLSWRSPAIIGLGVALVALVVLFWFLRNGAPLPPPTPAK